MAVVLSKHHISPRPRENINILVKKKKKRGEKISDSMSLKAFPSD